VAPLLELRDVVTVYRSAGRSVRAVDGVSFEVAEGEVFGLVGESGCGKSATCRSILRLFAGATASVEQGSIIFAGRDLARLSEREMRAVRGREISIIFQDPMSSLNPTMRIGEQIEEGLRRHRALARRAARHAAVELLGSVGVPSAAARLDSWPHEFSGGMRQRVLIAIALACRPKLLIADEPTTALDVTIQDQILKLILRLKEQLRMSVILVTHDLGIVAQTCDRVAVMYAGRIAELAETRTLFARPRHPYTTALLASLPGRHRRGQPLHVIPGAPPDLMAPPPGCRFHPRCSFAIDRCRHDPIVPRRIGDGHLSACIRSDVLA
jgi:oligopeptide/dipeptide ABC transporter ATP-binding protein